MMQQPKMEIIRFDGEDVIATSTILDSLLDQSVNPVVEIPEPGVWG